MEADLDPLALDVRRISNPWHELEKWPSGVTVYARYSQVVSDPEIKHDVTRTSKGVEIKTPISVDLEIADQLDPARRLLPVPDPAFKAKVNDDVAVLYAGREPKRLWRVAIVNLKTQFPHVDLLSESLDQLYPLDSPAYTWVALLTMVAMLCAMWFGQLWLFAVAVLGMAVTWHLLAPRRQFAMALRSRISALVQNIRADNY